MYATVGGWRGSPGAHRGRGSRRCSDPLLRPPPLAPPSKQSTEEVVDFLMRGASKAVDIIYEAIGPVGPPVRPGSGSLFIVDERRLFNWREDGYV